ncbi:hypothetical protein G6F68_019023 [Rhizopus microsporus]|nr:hypothetical protein G6F68_019023 [Rhizopus microsporus]
MGEHRSARCDARPAGCLLLDGCSDTDPKAPEPARRAVRACARFRNSPRSCTAPVPRGSLALRRCRCSSAPVGSGPLPSRLAAASPQRRAGGRWPSTRRECRSRPSPGTPPSHRTRSCTRSAARTAKPRSDKSP